MSNVFRDHGPAISPPMVNQELYESSIAYSQQIGGALEASALDDFDKSIFRRVLRQNADYEPGGTFYNRIGETFTQQSEVTAEQLFDIGIDLAGHITASSNNPRGVVLDYLNSLYHVSNIARGFTGNFPSRKAAEKKTNLQVNQILDYMRDVIAERLSTYPTSTRFMNTLFDSVGHAIDVTKGHENFYDNFVGEMFELGVLHHDINNLKKVAEKYYPQDEMASNDYEKVDVSGQVTELTRRGIEQRKYGIKSAYIEASIGGSWVFYDVDTLKRYAPETNTSQMVGVVFHSPHKELSNLRISQQEAAAQGRNKFYALGGAMEMVEPDLKIMINSDGSMGIYPRSLHTVDTVLADRPDAAAALKAEIAANFYDLTTPVHDESDAGPPNYPNIPQEQKGDFDPITQLLIPRVRRLNQPQSTASDVVREVRVHDVTWYVRPLRKGWRASLDAIARAKELNVTLAENETFVKAHTRGTRGEKALGHQAVR